jgi:hypothetical protein
MTLATALPAAIRSAIIGNAPIVALLGQYENEPSVHTRRPAPEGAEYPMVIVPSESASASDQDMMRRQIPVLGRDVLIYGRNPKDYREVDEAAELIFLLFHRQKWALSIEGYRVLDIVARRPTAAPTSDEKKVGRLVPLTIRLQGLAG